MIILQTAGGSDAGSLTLEGLLGERRPSATTFRSNAYIHRLNRALQAEMRAMAACRSLFDRHPDALALDHAIQAHQRAAHALVCLIVANRGVPEDRAALSFGLTRTFIRICSRVPVRLMERASVKTLCALEKSLVTTYERLLDEAPVRDRPSLVELHELAVVRREELSVLDGALAL